MSSRSICRPSQNCSFRKPRVIILYRFILYPLLFSVFWFLGLFNQKVNRGFEIRKKNKEGTLPWLDFSKNLKPIWFHCASGEFEYAKSVIKKIKTAFPNEKILVTYFSPTYADNVKKNAYVDMACPLPWDTQKSVQEFIRHHNPKALLIARTDLWPEVLKQCRNRELPTLLFSKTQVAVTNSFVQFFLRWIFGYLNQIYCVSEVDRHELLKIILNSTKYPEQKVIATGDTRFDQVVDRLQNPKKLKPFALPSKVLVAGSTWSEDEAILLPALARTKNEISLVIAPHEPTPEHIQKLQSHLKKLNWDTTLYSDASSWNPNSVLIIDEVGILADLYSWGQFAFVGGSFKKTVHSVMEPLASGCLTFVGPYHQNNRECIEFNNLTYENTKTVSYVQEFRSVNQLETLIKQSLNLNFIDFKSSLQSQIKRRTGTSEQVVKWISESVG